MHLSAHRVFFVVAAIAFLAVGCRPQSRQGEVVVSRFERIIGETADVALRDSLRVFAHQHPTPLLHVYPDDGQYMEMVRQYRADTVVRMIYDSVQRQYADLTWLEHDLYEALARAYKLDTAFVYRDFITFISNAGYGARVAADRDSRTVTIAIDEYVTPSMRQFGYFGEPLYLVRLCHPQYIAPDCMAEIARQHIALPDGEMTLLDYIVAEGKVQYFLHKVFPRVSDTVLFRYTEQQLHWMKDNEANVWGYFVHNKLLYEHDYARLRNFVEDAPKTNAFQESAPRTVAYIGYHIVDRYLKNSRGTTFAQLLEETDGQKILQTSGYRP